MKKPDHSPLPWTIERLEAGDYAIVDATGEIIAEPDYGNDARLIVAAVNSHADLLAAAKMAIAESNADRNAPMSWAAHTNLKAAIAKAWQAS